ncbi:MAG: translation initiation factor IF-2 subunit beta [Candidatus Altiarchaeota archaeon]
MEYDHKKLLDRLWENLPEKLKTSERFEMPKADVWVEGNTTIIRNFNEIATTLDRKPKYILQYLSKELAAPTTLETNRAIIQRKLRKTAIDEKIHAYAKEYVICHQCGRPDTQITSLEDQKIVKCTACGGWWPLRRIK